jgi:ParB-like chromosome segregation protein Spo0J
MGMEVENIDPHELRFSPTNARQHGERSIRAKMKSLQQFGQQKPIVVTKELEVIAGHGTLAAAMRLKMPKVWIVRSHLTYDEAQAYGIADNRTADLAKWDEEILKATLAQLAADDAKLLEASGFSAREAEVLLASARNEPMGSLGEAYTESVADDVEWRCCAECGHRWPK